MSRQVLLDFIKLDCDDFIAQSLLESVQKFKHRKKLIREFTNCFNIIISFKEQFVIIEDALLLSEWDHDYKMDLINFENLLKDIKRAKCRQTYIENFRQTFIQDIINYQNGNYPYLIYIQEKSIKQIIEIQKQDQSNLYFYANCIKMKNEADVYREFSRMLNFPNYFGKNCDAFNKSSFIKYLEHDMKCPNGELFSENPNANVVLILKNFKTFLSCVDDIEYNNILYILNSIGEEFSPESSMTREDILNRGFHTFLSNDDRLDKRQVEIMERYKIISLI